MVRDDVVANNHAVERTLLPFDAKAFAARQEVLEIGRAPVALQSPLHVKRGNVFLFIGQEIGAAAERGRALTLDRIGDVVSRRKQTAVQSRRDRFVIRLLAVTRPALEQHAKPITAHPALLQVAVGGVVGLGHSRPSLERERRRCKGNLVEIVVEEIDRLPRKRGRLGLDPIVVGKRKAQVPLHKLLGKADARLVEQCRQADARLGDAAAAPPSVERFQRDGAFGRKPDGCIPGVDVAADFGEGLAARVVHKPSDFVRAVHQEKRRLRAPASLARTAARLVDV